MDVHMSKVHQATYDAIFQHPAARNLQWRDVRSMLDSIAEVEEEHNGHLIFTRHGERLTVHRPKGKDISNIEELMEIRHFLERSVVPSSQAVADRIVGTDVVNAQHLTEDQILAKARTFYEAIEARDAETM